MWQMIAEPGLRCAECRHTIKAGRLCLSELPEETPAGVGRGDFKNYCIGCPECWAQGKHTCYVRHLDSGGSTGKTPRSLPCARCGRRIGAGEKAGVDIYYEWPGQTADESSGPLTKSAIAGLAVAAQAGTIIRGVPDGSFSSLRDELQRKFKDAGLRPEQGTRTTIEREALYKESVPTIVRNYGEDAVLKFLKDKDASHIQSVHNSPHLAKDNSNIIWEDSGTNRVRGAENMTWGEELQARATNAFDASKIVAKPLFRDCVGSATIAAIFASLMEAPVAAIENYIHYQKGRKTGEQAIIDAAKSIAMRAISAAVVGFAVTGAVALLGAGPLLVTIAPVLIPVGLALYGLSALKRILNALKDGLPLHQVGTYFCSPGCHTKFAYETGYSALMRWEENRVSSAT